MDTDEGQAQERDDLHNTEGDADAAQIAAASPDVVAPGTGRSAPVAPPAPPAPGGHEPLAPRLPARGVPPVAGSPAVVTPVPAPGQWPGRGVPGVRLGHRPRHPGERFGWPAIAATGKPEGEVDTEAAKRPGTAS